MKPCEFEDSLGLAEYACAQHIHVRTGMMVCIATNDRGAPDCAVFDIGYLQTGEFAAFPSSAFHFRAKLDIYRRSRPDLQKAIMCLLASFPINADQNADAELRENSNVIVFRVAPQTQGISEISTVDIQPTKDAKAIRCWCATVQFDVVFRSRF